MSKVIFWNFRGGCNPDGTLNAGGIKICDAYAKKWAAHGVRDRRLEHGYPELVDRFEEIRNDDEVLAFHLLEIPGEQPTKKAALLIFPTKHEAGRPG